MILTENQIKKIERAKTTGLISEKSLFENDDGTYFFTASMISTADPLLNDCDSNYEVADLLEREEVITQDMTEDSESCQLWVYFKTREQGITFINNLNQFLKRRANERPSWI